MSQMQRYLTEVLGLNYIIKPDRASVISLAQDRVVQSHEAVVGKASPKSLKPIEEVRDKLKTAKPTEVQPKEPKPIELDKIPDIRIRINPKAKILFLVPEKINKLQNEVLHNISKACKPRPVILVNPKQLKSENYLADLKDSNITHGICFGAEPFKSVSGDSFFDYFKKQTEAFGLKWLATHSLEKLSDKKSENITTFKKETWSQLQGLFKETQ